MPLKDSKIFLKLRCLMSIVHIIEVFKTKQIFLQKVVDPFGKSSLHEVNVTNRIIHKVQLPLQNKEIVKYFVLEDNFLIMVDFDKRHLIVQFDYLI